MAAGVAPRRSAGAADPALVLEAVIDLQLRRCHDLRRGRKRHLGAMLERAGIEILPGFTDNESRVREFFRRYYSRGHRRVAWVGLNPGRFGGGKTGLAFLDGEAVSALLGGESRSRERSARFLWSVIARVGPGRFFDRVYLTNLSWLGFVRGGRNLNLDALPAPVRETMIAGFVEEMRLVRPERIVPLGRVVERELAALRERGLLNVPAGPRLPHPRHAAFPSRRELAVRGYLQAVAADG